MSDLIEEYERQKREFMQNALQLLRNQNNLYAPSRSREDFDAFSANQPLSPKPIPTEPVIRPSANAWDVAMKTNHHHRTNNSSRYEYYCSTCSKKWTMNIVSGRSIMQECRRCHKSITGKQLKQSERETSRNVERNTSSITSLPLPPLPQVPSTPPRKIQEEISATEVTPKRLKIPEEEFDRIPLTIQIHPFEEKEMEEKKMIKEIEENTQKENNVQKEEKVEVKTKEKRNKIEKQEKEGRKIEKQEKREKKIEKKEKEEKRVSFPSRKRKLFEVEEENQTVEDECEFSRVLQRFIQVTFTESIEIELISTLMYDKIQQEFTNAIKSFQK